MSTINNQQLKEEIRKCPDLNFIASVITPWHTLGVEASLLWLQDNGFKPNGICLVTSHYTYGFVCDESIFTNTSSKKFRILPGGKTKSEKIKDKIFLYKFIFHNRKRQRDEQPFYIISTKCNTNIASYAYKLLPLRHIVYVNMEEGVGAYLDTVNPIIPKITSLKTFLKYLNVKNNILLNKYVVKHHDVINNSLFIVEKDERLIKNERILPYYAEAIRIKAAKVVDPSDSIELGSTIIICTTAWERRQIQDDEDMRVLRIVCDYLYEKGYKIVLKPHPRDSFFADKAEELHAGILGFSYPMESICALSRPKAIVSFSSTILVTGKLFWNIPGFCLSEMLDKSKISPFYLKETGNFHKVFSEYVAFPKSVEEIIL